MAKVEINFGFLTVYFKNDKKIAPLLRGAMVLMPNKQ